MYTRVIREWDEAKNFGIFLIFDFDNNNLKIFEF